jgi:Leucine-rich repeat (LRR) protein
MLVLSLSHNGFTSLDGFHHFLSLRELNVNFNKLTTIDGLVAPNLTHLYLSTNW